MFYRGLGYLPELVQILKDLIGISAFYCDRAQCFVYVRAQLGSCSYALQYFLCYVHGQDRCEKDTKNKTYNKENGRIS